MTFRTSMITADVLTCLDKEPPCRTSGSQAALSSTPASIVNSDMPNRCFWLTRQLKELIQNFTGGLPAQNLSLKRSVRATAVGARTDLDAAHPVVDTSDDTG